MGGPLLPYGEGAWTYPPPPSLLLLPPPYGIAAPFFAPNPMLLLLFMPPPPLRSIINAFLLFFAGLDGESPLLPPANVPLRASRRLLHGSTMVAIISPI